MTPEQFIYWLSGFISGSDVYLTKRSDEIMKISEALTKVKLFHPIAFSCEMGTEETTQ